MVFLVYLGMIQKLLINKKTFKILGVVFLILLVAGIFVYKKGIFSKEILKLEILSKENCQMGGEVEYTLRYKNNGNTRLEGLRLLFEYPENSLPEGTNLTVNKELEDLYPAQEATLKFKARLFGREGDVLTTKASLSYKPKNLKARYESKTTFSTKIDNVPLTFRFDFPSKIESGKNFTTSINYFSNLDYPLSDLTVKTTYPANFEFSGAEPTGLAYNEWTIGVLNKAEGGRIKISGKLNGNPGEKGIFRAEMGIWIHNRYVALKEDMRGTEIIRPLLVISQTINGSSEYTANPGEILRYEIFFRNVGEEPFEDLFMVSRLDGPFDFRTIKAETGKVNEADHSIIWDGREIPQLRFLAPGEEGRVEFWVSLKQEFGPGSNFTARNVISAPPAKEEFTIKISSRLVLEQKGYFQDEVFGNSGPIPPRVGEETTYTIVWNIKNYYNGMKDVKVKANLAPGVRLTGKFFPQEEQSKFSFDINSKELVWDIGDLSAGAGLISNQKSIAFQIALLPSESQKNSTAILISEATISGEDQFTKTILRTIAPAIDTTLPDDPSISSEQGIVQ